MSTYWIVIGYVSFVLTLAVFCVLWHVNKDKSLLKKKHVFGFALLMFPVVGWLGFGSLLEIGARIMLVIFDSLDKLES